MADVIHAKEIGVVPQQTYSRCGLQGNITVSYHWDDVTCEKCLEVGPEPKLTGLAGFLSGCGCIALPSTGHTLALITIVAVALL